jgi:hypothetical protein
MFEKIANGWTLTKQSFHVLSLDKELLLFPLLSGIACILVLISFAVPLWTTGQVQAMNADGDIVHNPLAYIVLFAFYFINYFVIVFFNSALVACAVIRFKGGDPTVSDGLRAASNRLPQIAAWALVSATVGLVLKLIAERSGKVGEIVSSLFGAAWSIATYFVVPIIVVERASPVDAFKRSVAVLRRSWGESLVANAGIGFIVFLASIAAMIPMFLGIWSQNTTMMIVGISTSVIAILLISLVSSALHAIVIGALYLYAAEGRVPEYFDEGTLSNAFHHA